MEDRYGQLRKESKRKGGGSALKVSFKQLEQVSRLHVLILRDLMGMAIEQGISTPELWNNS